jgi:RHS repeat-associated protein
MPWDQPAAAPARVTRGFTDHEHLDALGLVHMNGRIYDAQIGKFLSADPFIDGTEDSQPIGSSWEADDCASCWDGCGLRNPEAHPVGAVSG